MKKGKRKPWSTYEIDMVIKLYPVKSVKWIASYLGRKSTDVNSKLAYMRKNGLKLPNKRAVNSKVTIE